MSTKEWAAVALVIGAGILYPIVDHYGDKMDQGEHTEMVIPTDTEGPIQTVALDVTGMT